MRAYCDEAMTPVHSNRDLSAVSRYSRKALPSAEKFFEKLRPQ